jgi:hypothetical protein
MRQDQRLPGPGKPGGPGETPQPRESAGTRAVVEGQRPKPTSPPSADRESSAPEQPAVASGQPEPETDPESRQPRDRDGL